MFTMIATGAAQSPAIMARFPWYVRLFGGRQWARSLHFVGMFGLVLVVAFGLGMAAGSQDLLGIEFEDFELARSFGADSSNPFSRPRELEELLAAIPPGKRLVIEVKDGPSAIPVLAQAVQRSGRRTNELVIIGFDFDAMKAAREAFPDIPVLWLASFDDQQQADRSTPTLEELIPKAVAARFDGLNLSYKWPINGPFVRKVKDAGLKLYVWTVDDAEVARELVAAGVDGITTDRIDNAQALLR